MAYRIGIVGLGKITEDQHVPVIGKNPAFSLVAVASQRGLTVPGAKAFRSLGEMLAGAPDLDAVAVCTPPHARHAIAREALLAGRHVLLEKPPTATLGELQDLVALAAEKGVVLFQTWHSQYNAAVDRARDLLSGKSVTELAIVWKEDVRRWHPGQKWIWEAGGYGVFDPGINALSIVSKIMPEKVLVTAAELETPSDCDAPIAARLTLATPSCRSGMSAVFDWRQQGEQTWDIAVATADGLRLKLTHGGSRLEVDGRPEVGEKLAEYEAIYERFATLLAAGTSEVDREPLRLVADAFLVGRRVTTDPFGDR